MTIVRILGLSILAAAGCSAASATDDDSDSGRLGADDPEDDADASSSGASSSGAVASSSSSSSGAVAPTFDAPVALADVRITRVWGLQSVAVPLAEDGVAAAPDLPLVAGRDLFVRVFLGAASAARDVDVQVLIETPGGEPQIFHAAWTLGASASTEASQESTPVVRVPADAVTRGVRWAVRVVDANADPIDVGSEHAARFPKDGSRRDLDARDVASPKVVIVPFRWEVDGSHRLPDTSPAAMTALRTQLLAWYPIHDVDLVLHDPIDYAKALGSDGDVDFYDVNDVLYDLRGAEHPAANVYYYGLLAPAASFDDYCTNVCTTGQSYTVSDVTDADIRVGAGVSFTREGAANTFAHELGHLFGRGHSPCNVTSWDADYPYLHGLIGTWGWGDDHLVDPAVFTDFMGYCDDQWVSDYTYRALYERTVALASTPSLLPDATLDRVRLVHVDATGALTLGRSVRSKPHPGGAQATVRWLGANGRALSTHVVRAERLGKDGVTLFVPDVPGGVRVELAN